MRDSITYELANRVTPSPGLPEWYFFILVLAILLGMIIWRYMDRYNAQKDKKQDGDLRDLVISLRTELLFRMEHQEERLEAFERKLEDGFRSIHKRMDDHIDNHQARHEWH